jgi:hypothetical protein
MLENYVCNDRTRNDEVANILLSFNRKNTLDNSCDDKEEKNSEGKNKGDKYDQFEANVNMSGRELEEGNVCVAEECGVDDCEGQFEENSKTTFDINCGNVRLLVARHSALQMEREWAPMIGYSGL